MLLVKNKKLKCILEDIDTEGINICLYQRDMGGYSAWILCCEMLNQKILADKWNQVVDSFALNFQAELEVAIERYNVYIIFFIADEVSNELRITIEQDKYSSRKILIKQSMPSSSEELMGIIEKRLFRVSKADKQQECEQDVLEKWLRETDENFLELFLKDKSTPRGLPIFHCLGEYVTFFAEEKDGELI